MTFSPSGRPGDKKSLKKESDIAFSITPSQTPTQRRSRSNGRRVDPHAKQDNCL